MKGLKMGLEIAVIVGYAIGLFPFMYAATCWFVIPLTIVNVILATVIWNSIGKSIVNVLCSVLGLIPFVGIVPRLAGIVLSILSISNSTTEDK